MFQNSTNTSITGVSSAVLTYLLDFLPSWSQTIDTFIVFGQVAGAALAIASLYEYIKQKNKK